MPYVDGYVLVVPTKKLAAYKKMATVASEVWTDHGALSYRECVGDDMNPPMGMSFTKLAGAKKSETVIFAWVEYKNRAHRDRVNAKVMKDERLAAFMGQPMPFDPGRMAYGGFLPLVSRDGR